MEISHQINYQQITYPVMLFNAYAHLEFILYYKLYERK